MRGGLGRIVAVGTEGVERRCGGGARKRVCVAMVSFFFLVVRTRNKRHTHINTHHMSFYLPDVLETGVAMRRGYGVVDGGAHRPLVGGSREEFPIATTQHENEKVESSRLGDKGWICFVLGVVVTVGVVVEVVLLSRVTLKASLDF